MDDWACTICTFINKSNKTNCEQCTTEKTYLNSDIFLNALKKVNSSLFNEINRISSLEISNEERSAQYFGSLSKYFKQTSREEVSHWKCNNCNVLNPNIVDLCTVCNASNPNVLYQRSDSYRESERNVLESEKLEREYFECPVCMDDKASVSDSYTLDCNHRIHNECILRLITYKINSNEVGEQELCCPYLNCKCSILEATVRELCPNEIYQKFLNCRKDIYLQKEEAERKRFAEWQVLNANADESFQKWVRESGAKPCPNCKALILRECGSDDMICQICKCYFCYICGGYNSNNPQSKGDCGSTCKKIKNKVCSQSRGDCGQVCTTNPVFYQDDANESHW